MVWIRLEPCERQSALFQRCAISFMLFQRALVIGRTEAGRGQTSREIRRWRTDYGSREHQLQGYETWEARAARWMRASRAPQRIEKHPLGTPPRPRSQQIT